jgi:hypothetical protein
MISRNLISKSGILIAFLIALTIYGFSAGLKITKQSRTPQYVYLAYSLINGHMDLVAFPESKFDLINYQDKWYVPGGIGPALILIPFVAIFGYGISDILFGVILGAINVALIYHLLGKLKPTLSSQIGITLLFAFGTVHWWLSSVGSVWFNAHLVACLFMILYVYSTLDDRPWLAGLCLGLAALSRPPTLFSAVFFIAYTYIHNRNIRLALNKILPFTATFGSMIFFLLLSNYLRFGNFMEFGYLYVQGTRSLTDAFSSGGGFNPSYIPCNMYVSLIGLPNLPWSPLPSVNDMCQHLEPIIHDFTGLSEFFNPLGMSIFLTTPAFLLIFRAGFHKPLVQSAWLGILTTITVLWMYHTTGWVQFGYRYTLDFIVFLVLLLSQSIKRITFIEVMLIGFSILLGATGMYLMYYMTFGIIWHEMALEMLHKMYWIIF